MVSVLEEVLAELRPARLLVLGDCMLDRFVFAEAERVSAEAAALVLRRQREEIRPGGAANVAVLAQALGASVSLGGLIGTGEDGWRLRRLLSDAGIDDDGLLCDPLRPTTAKQRFCAQVGNGLVQQLVRVDQESREPLPLMLRRRLRQWLLRQVQQCDAVLLADHGKGVCDNDLLAEVFAAAQQRDVAVLVDPARGADFAAYRGAELLLPNRAEAAQASGRRVGNTEEALAAARDLRQRTGVPGVLVKLDRDGMVLDVADEPPRVFPARASLVREVSGAGDEVLALLGLCRASGVVWPAAVELASVAAGLHVGGGAATPLRREDLHTAVQASRPSQSKVVSLQRLAERAEGYRRQGKRVVLTNGCFDLVHAGHAAYLEEAKTLGDVLVVAVNDDVSVRRLKGQGRPVVPQAERMALLAALACVDHVLLFAADTPHEVLRRVRPDVLVKGGDYTVDEVVGREVVVEQGGQVHVTGKHTGLSTTHLIATVRQPTGLTGN
jgi:D-beta-D-heptose 7-phosphate kinase/D-beta-D-heptose 1-phosphate adenosyltransferase